MRVFRVGPRFRSVLLSALSLSALTATSVGCSDDFVPYNRLTSFRILGIQAFPALPGPGETTTLTPIYFTPDDAPPISFKWDQCFIPGPADQGYVCQDDKILPMFGVQVPPSDLGTGPTAMFTHSLPPEKLKEFCATGQFNCTIGFPVQIKMTATDSANVEIKTVLTLRLRFEAEDEPNENPLVTGISAVIDGVEQPITDDPNTPVTLLRDHETVIRIGLNEDAAERYNGRRDNGGRGPQREWLRATWFVESGGMKDDFTAFLEDEAGTIIEPIEDARENRWTPAKLEDYPGDIARLVVVVRDRRGGVSAVRGRVRLEDAP